MAILHHASDFWLDSNNWVQPQNFDTLIKVLIAIYLIITFIPDFVKYFSITRYKKLEKDRKFIFNKLSEILPEFGEKNKAKKDLFLNVYSNYLTKIDWSFDQIEANLFKVWKRHIFWHILVLIICISYLFFSANNNSSIEIHRWMLSIFILLLLIPFFSALYYAFVSIKTETKNLENYYVKIREVSKEFSDKGIDGVFEFINKNFLND